DRVVGVQRDQAVDPPADLLDLRRVVAVRDAVRIGNADLRREAGPGARRAREARAVAERALDGGLERDEGPRGLARGSVERLARPQVESVVVTVGGLDAAHRVAPVVGL